ncbi:DUF1707 domain-containing protein [Nocardia huaxiensis]|uniref:DUF1707 domain-containing protein n=2 Tax=Nocardia huaxiensis TaxID=2755382 RepID=A0A7D6Z923_9NOCA|nr:DUF1707 domain-containing protein [Nocardia huaxiensis]
MRASDADREQIVARLKTAMDEGRLTLHEFDERLQRVYSARTYGELAPVLSDLPAQRVSPPPVTKPKGFPTWVKIMWTPWVFVNALCLVIWAVTGAGYFWPIWVAAPWGLALLIPTTIGRLVENDNHRKRQERQRKQLERG